MKKGKIGFKLLPAALSIFILVSGCANIAAGGQFNRQENINVLSREEGSGTRGVFVELFGVEEKDAQGNKTDKTVATAEITSSTSVMLSKVAGDFHSVGYISLGSLNDSVKALAVEGVTPSAETVQKGTYPVSRPFNIVTNSKPDDLTKDFINYIVSAQGQAIVSETGFVPVDDTGEFTSQKPEGKIVIAGSTSVSPVMEKLREAYLKLNTNGAIDLETSDSTTGVNSTVSGIANIGMVSRELKDNEVKQDIVSYTIAKDGIVVIVNQENPIKEITIDQVKGIYTGKIQGWGEVAG